MSKNFLFIVFTVLFTIFSMFICSVDAQDISVGEMSNEQLLQLLQEIMQKLNQEEQASESALGLPALTPISVPQETEIRTFRIYENKKLLIESLPAYYFIKPTEEPSESPDSKDSSGTPETNCHDYCANKCYGISIMCFQDCYRDVCGEEAPEPKG